MVNIVMPIATDNASNMDVTVKSAQVTYHIKCFDHIINLGLQHALEVNRLRSKVRIVSVFHQINIATYLLKSKQHMVKLPKQKLIQDVSTWWNSSYDMLTRFLEQYPAITASLMNKHIWQNEKYINTLSETEVFNTDVVSVDKVWKQ